MARKFSIKFVFIEISAFRDITKMYKKSTIFKISRKFILHNNDSETVRNRLCLIYVGTVLLSTSPTISYGGDARAASEREGTTLEPPFSEGFGRCLR